ncbi:hypothetical protein HDV57DRAFT_469443 [Trichoderma longibrachiatum]
MPTQRHAESQIIIVPASTSTPTWTCAATTAATTSSITGISPSPALRPITAAASLHHLPHSCASAAVGYRGSGSAMPSSICTTLHASSLRVLCNRTSTGERGTAPHSLRFSQGVCVRLWGGTFFFFSTPSAFEPLPNGMGRTDRAERSVSRLVQSRRAGVRIKDGRTGGWLCPGRPAKHLTAAAEQHICISPARLHDKQQGSAPSTQCAFPC